MGLSLKEAILSEILEDADTKVLSDLWEQTNIPNTQFVKLSQENFSYLMRPEPLFEMLINELGYRGQI